MEKYIELENVVIYVPVRFSGKNLQIVPGCSYISQEFLSSVECPGVALCDQIRVSSLAENFVFILHVVLQVLPAGSSVPSSDLCHWNWCSSNLILFLFFLGLQRNHRLAKQNARVHWGSCSCSNSWELDKGRGLAQVKYCWWFHKVNLPHLMEDKSWPPPGCQKELQGLFVILKILQKFKLF